MQLTFIIAWSNDATNIIEQKNHSMIMAVNKQDNDGDSISTQAGMYTIISIASIWRQYQGWWKEDEVG